MSSFLTPKHSKYDLHSERKKNSLMKIDHTKSKILFSIGDDTDLPIFEDLRSFFHDKLDVATSGIDNIILDAKVCKIEAGNIIVDMNLKNYGRVHKDELRNGLNSVPVSVGDTIQVVAESIDARNGQYIKASWEKARRLSLWSEFEKAKNEKTILYGAIVRDTRGGYIANISGVNCFVPGSHVDFRIPEKHMLDSLMESELPFMILSMERDDKKDNIVVSRREVLNQERMKLKDEAIKQIKIGDVLEGVIKSLAPYGAFVNITLPKPEGSLDSNIDNVDGLVHIHDISWCKVSHPSELLSIGDVVKVVVINLIPEERKISLGIKQLQSSPWKGLASQLVIGSKINGVVKNTTDYGCFVEIRAGVEGLVHVSEVSWTKKNVSFSVGQEVEVMILAVDEEKTRISLSIKQCSENPWKKFASENLPGSVISVVVKKVVEFGVFVDLSFGVDQSAGIEGLIHISDVSWDNSKTQEALSKIRYDSKIDVKILSVDVEKGRIALGLKQLEKDYLEEFLDKVAVGDVIKNCTIYGSWNDKLEIEIQEARTIVSIDVSTLPENYYTEKQGIYAKGKGLDVKITGISKETRKLTVAAVANS